MNVMPDDGKNVPEKVACFSADDKWTRGQYRLFIALNLLPMILVLLYPLNTWVEMNWVSTGHVVALLAFSPAIFIFLIGPAWPVAGIVLLFWRRHFKRGIVMVVCAVGWCVCLIVANQLVLEIRITRFVQAGVDAKPLIAAIEQYVSDNQVAPEELADLAPRYLATVPGTGIPAYPEFDFRNNSSVQPNKCELSIPASYGMNSDQYLYLPEGNYPLAGYGGVLRRYGNWAYVFE